MENETKILSAGATIPDREELGREKLIALAEKFCDAREDENGSIGSVWAIMADFVLSLSLPTQWTEIKSEDDLPKEAAQYLWRFRPHRGDASTVQYFHSRDPQQWFLDEYSHWMPIPATPFVKEQTI